jgi:2,3-bisphosphoglycerate-dependent phosphoglycerate mutase
MNYIFLFRHGQTTYNRDKRFTGFKNPKLTKLGVKQAKELSKKLKTKKFQLAIHTSLSRSKDTLKYILVNHPECKTLIEDDRMIERSYGDLSGKTHNEIIKKYGSEKFDRWHRGYSTKNRPPNGECFKDVEKRVKKFIIDLKRLIKKNKINVAISAHGNSIRLFRKIMERQSIEKTTKWFIPYDKIFIYKI